MHLAAHVGQLECRPCSVQTARALAGSLDAARCEVRRGRATLELFASVLGTLLFTGRCCAGCRPTVYGDAACRTGCSQWTGGSPADLGRRSK